MNIQNLSLERSMGFKGVKPIYTNEKGYKVIPIEKNPESEEIEAAIEVAKSGKPNKGCNGMAYFWGEDLVVKKYMPKSEAINYNPEKEIKILDAMYDMGVKSKNIQTGKYAFRTPDDEYYLVSSRVKGTNPDMQDNLLNSDNLKSLVDTIGDLDMPKSKYRNDIFPYEVSLHYDLSPGNILVTDKEGGIIDFEYTQKEDLNSCMLKQNEGQVVTHCDFSDIAGIPSNLRNFENKTLNKYLLKQKPKDAKYLFKKYIKEKSNYHKKRADFYDIESKNAGKTENFKLEKLCQIYREKEMAHSMLLANADENILKSEAKKIQIADFIYTQSHFSTSEKDRVNINQIIEYVDDAEKFFKTQYQKAKTNNEQIYYDDCLKLIYNWKGVKGWIQYQKGLVEQMRSEEEMTENETKVAKIFDRKLTEKRQKTLDEHIFNS